MKTSWKSILLIFLFLPGCTTIILVRSSWNPSTIVIDGKENDWTDRTVFLSDQNISLGVTNDTSSLCLYVKSVDRQQMRRIRTAGLTIWLDPSGGDDKVFGIRIPGKRLRPGEESQNDVGMTANILDEIEIVQQEDDPHPLRIPVAQLKGIQIGSSSSRDGLMYEIRIPFHLTVEGGAHINLSGNEVGIGLVAGKFARKNEGEERKTEGMERESGGMAGEMGDESGMYGGRRGRDRSSGDMENRTRTESLDFWFKARLANKISE